MALMHTLPPVQYTLGLFPVRKAPGALRQPPTPPSAKVKNKYSNNSTIFLGLCGLV